MDSANIEKVVDEDNTSLDSNFMASMMPTKQQRLVFRSRYYIDYVKQTL
jgi:hypothetical protein